MSEFVRLAEVINKKQDIRIVSVTVIPHHRLFRHDMDYGYVAEGRGDRVLTV